MHQPGVSPERPAECFAARVQPWRVLRCEQHEVWVWPHHLLELRHKQLTVVIQQPAGRDAGERVKDRGQGTSQAPKQRVNSMLGMPSNIAGYERNVECMPLQSTVMVWSGSSGCVEHSCVQRGL
jgi:hypothetical protein